MSLAHSGTKPHQGPALSTGLTENFFKGRAHSSGLESMRRTVDGIGSILALTIMLETGEIGRLAGVGQFASYCRCVGSQKLSNGKKKGSANTKNGNRYLAWAFIEAANFAIRYNPRVKRFYQLRSALGRIRYPGRPFVAVGQHGAGAVGNSYLPLHYPGGRITSLCLDVAHS